MLKHLCVAAALVCLILSAGCSGGGHSAGNGGGGGGNGGGGGGTFTPPSGTGPYDPGSFTVQDLWVNPTTGDDGRTGATRAEALRTVNAAWNRIPTDTALTTGYRLRLCAGLYPRDALPNYWEKRRGTRAHPIILEGADARDSAIFAGDINAFQCDYLYLRNFTIITNPPGDVLHLEQCHGFWMTGMVMNGGGGAQEVIKVNQSQGVYIERSDIFGAYENAIDFVAVQYAGIFGNRLHDAGDWVMYVKGGSAYIQVDSNEIYNGDTGGFTAGQGTGFEFMVAPWLHYEAYDVKFVNNVVHDCVGAGMGVNGGYNILLAYNTLYRVGSRSHAIEIVHGLRACDGDAARCAEYVGLGGWGSTSSHEEPIPAHSVYVYNNVLLNPTGFQSMWSHFAVAGPRTPSGGTHIPPPSTVDGNLRIAGNIIWNGPADLALGVGDDGQGGQPDNPTCNATLVRAQNAINTLLPQLVSPATGDFRPAGGGNVATYAAVAIPAFTWDDAPQPPAVPQGTLSNTVPTTRDGNARGNPGHPGAY